jgi:hypothetical protein
MKQGIDIEIDIFSGQPNPKIEVHGRKAKRLVTLLAQARDLLQDYTPNNGLGFRGFVIHFDNPKMETYRVDGEKLVRDGTAFYDPKLETQSYIVSLLPHTIKNLVTPFIATVPQ